MANVYVNGESKSFGHMSVGTATWEMGATASCGTGKRMLTVRLSLYWRAILCRCSSCVSVHIVSVGRTNENVVIVDHLLAN